MFCVKCGNDLPEGTKFCGSCGERMDSLSVESDPEIVVETPALQQPAYAATQPAYATPQPHQQGVPSHYRTEPLSVGNYVGTLLLLCVPILGFVLSLIWAFDGSTNINKKNLARAILILGVIGILFWILVGGLIIGSLASISSILS